MEEWRMGVVGVKGGNRGQGYYGEGGWGVIGEVAQTVAIPVIGNGDLFSPQEVARRGAETKIAGVMIGRAAMSAPWIFGQIKHYLATGELLPPPELSERWNVIIGHCRTHAKNWGDEEQAIRSMRARLMAYSKNFPTAKVLREKFQRVATLTDVEQIADQHLAHTAMMSDLVGQAFGPDTTLTLNT